MTKISYNESLASLQYDDLKLPMSMPICETCHNGLIEKLASVQMDSQGTDSSGTTYHEPSSEEFFPSQISSGSSTQQAQEENKNKIQLEKLNAFMRACQLEGDSHKMILNQNQFSIITTVSFLLKDSIVSSVESQN